MQVLVTGNAGFIGFHVARQLLLRGDAVVGLDNVNAYYDPSLKEARLDELDKTAGSSNGKYEFVRGDIADQKTVDDIFSHYEFDRVIHLAAQPGVRYSLDNPRAYTRSNIDAFLNILEACRHADTPHLTYASSSSVYGANTKMPFSEYDRVNRPLALYGATKRANELMAHAYSHLYGLPTTGLRFFTVYGPWGRPDMAYFKFTRKILAGEPIQVFGHGNHSRDFTYIDDIVEGVIRASDEIVSTGAESNANNPGPANVPYRIFNIGNNNSIKLDKYIEVIERVLGRKAIMEQLPSQPGDVLDTCADVSELENHVGYKPGTSVLEGVKRFVGWYREYYGV